MAGAVQIQAVDGSVEQTGCDQGAVSRDDLGQLEVQGSTRDLLGRG